MIVFVIISAPHPADYRDKEMGIAKILIQMQNLSGLFGKIQGDSRLAQVLSPGAVEMTIAG